MEVPSATSSVVRCVAILSIGCLSLGILFGRSQHNRIGSKLGMPDFDGVWAAAFFWRFSLALSVSRRNIYARCPAYRAEASGFRIREEQRKEGFSASVHLLRRAPGIRAVQDLWNFFRAGKE